jgi:hypothetical protein
MFMINASYLVWNDWNIPVVFLGETKEVKAMILDYKVVPKITRKGNV